MPVTALPLNPGAQARALLRHLLDAGDIVGRDEAGRTVIQLAADDWLLDQLMTFDAGAEDVEDGGDAEDDGPAVLSLAGCGKRWPNGVDLVGLLGTATRCGIWRCGAATFGRKRCSPT